jgi:hypothetical protein
MRVTIRELLRRVPEAASAFEQLVGERSAAYPVIPFALEPHHVDVDFLVNDPRLVTWPTLRDDLRIPAEITIAEGRPSHFGGGQPAAAVRTPWDQAGWLWPVLALDVNDNSWIIASLGDQHWNQLVVQHAVAFCLGTLVRYNPSLWVELSSQPRGDLSLPLLKDARVAIEAALPRLLVRQFTIARSSTL